MYLAIYRTLRLMEQINRLCHQLFLMELYILGMSQRGAPRPEPEDYDSRRARGEI